MPTTGSSTTSAASATAAASATTVNKPPMPMPQPPPPSAPPGSRAQTAVKLNDMPWFHGKISRDEAEKLLLTGDSTAPDGLFLVRESTNFPGDYTLCVVFQGKVEHYRVIALQNRLTIDEEEYFENLTKLVEVVSCGEF